MFTTNFDLVFTNFFGAIPHKQDIQTYRIVQSWYNNGYFINHNKYSIKISSNIKIPLKSKLLSWIYKLMTGSDLGSDDCFILLNELYNKSHPMCNDYDNNSH